MNFSHANYIELVVTREFSASPEQVFDAWLDAKTVGRWLFATPEGKMQQVEVDARVGGKLTIVEKRGDALASHFGTFEEIVRPHRLVFLFSTSCEANPSRVTVEIAATPGGCTLTLTQQIDAHWAEFAERTRDGWTKILEGLFNHVK